MIIFSRWQRFLFSIVFLSFTSNSFAATEIYNFLNPAQAQRFELLSQELRCVVCQNQNLADSNAPLAVDLKNEIAKQIQQGSSDADVKKYLVARYGDFILFKPKVTPLTYLLWGAPLVLVLGGLLFLVIFIKRRRS